MNLAAQFDEGWKLAWTRVDGWVAGLVALLPNLVVGVLVLGVFVAMAFAARVGVRSSFDRRGRRDLGAMLASFLLWAISFAGLLVALTIILPSLNPGDLVAGLGIGSVAIGFAFKDILQNWLAGLLILLRQPFRRGDQVRVGEFEGTVHRIDQRATLIRTYDNRMVVVPNADIYTSSVAVHTAYPTRRISLDVTIGYDYDIEEVRGLIRETLLALEEVLPDPPPQILCWELGSTSLLIRVRWWIESRRSAEIAARGRVVQAIKEAFQASGIDPTDPQIVFSHIVRRDRAASSSPGSQPNGPLAPPARLPVADGDPENEQPAEVPEAGALASRPDAG